MYALIFLIILVNLIVWSLASNTSFLYADKPQPKPQPQAKPKPQPQAKPQAKPNVFKPNASTKPPSATLLNNAKKFFEKNPGRINNPPAAYKDIVKSGFITGGAARPDISKFSTSDGKPPTTSRLENAKKFFEKNPDRVKNPPEAYKGLIEAGYIKQDGNKFTVNNSPTGRPPARVLGTGGSNSGGKLPPLKGGIANQAWDDYNNKYANKTSVGDAKVVMTDPRNDKFGSDPKKVAEYNAQLVAQGKVPMAYMNTGMVDTPEQYGSDKAFDKLYKDLKAAGLVGPKDPKWHENILDGKKLLNDPSAMAKAKAAYTDFAKSMKDLGYKAINVDNLDFYNKGSINSKLSKADQQKLGLGWQSMVADVIHGQGMYAVAKNAPELVNMPGSNYVQKWDAIVTENAVGPDWNDTAAYKKFADAGKPVWNFQTETGYSKYNVPGWIDSYAVGQGKQGWWAT